MQSISISVLLDYYSSLISSVGESVFNVKSELGYTWLIDSLWKKQSDQLSIQYLLKRSGKKVSRSVNAGLNSQILNGFTFETDVVQQKVKRKWNGTFFNPSALELGCGLSMQFWNYSHFNISLATARIRMEPIVDSFRKPSNGVLGRIKRGWVLFDYGLSGQLLFNKTISPALEWNGSGKIFMKGIQKEHFSFDFSNTMRYRFRKHAALTADLKCIYDPAVSLRLQHRNELLVGLIYFYEK